MALADILRNGVKVASKIVESVKSNVTWVHVTARDGSGTVTATTTSTVRAIVDRSKKQIHTSSGKLAMLDATLTFVDPIGAVDPEDTFTLPDGTTAPIIDTGGVVDPATSQSFVNEVKLGTILRGQ